MEQIDSVHCTDCPEVERKEGGVEPLKDWPVLLLVRKHSRGSSSEQIYACPECGIQIEIRLSE